MQVISWFLSGLIVRPLSLSQNCSQTPELPFGVLDFQVKLTSRSSHQGLEGLDEKYCMGELLSPYQVHCDLVYFMNLMEQPEFL
jgi:hypothetical protein